MGVAEIIEPPLGLPSLEHPTKTQQPEHLYDPEFLVLVPCYIGQPVDRHLPEHCTELFIVKILPYSLLLNVFPDESRAIGGRVSEYNRAEEVVAAIVLLPKAKLEVGEGGNVLLVDSATKLLHLPAIYMQ